MTKEHTPAPWKVYLYGGVQIGQEDTGDAVCSMWGDKEEGEANAAHIVKCVNLHDELVGALEGMLKYIPDGIVECRGDKCREPWCASCYGFEAAESALDQIRFDYQRSKVALAKARGEV